MNLYEIKSHEQSPNIVNVVVEIPRGTSAKYEYDDQLDVFRLDRVLHSAMVYPGNYGFITNTKADDGDPLDAILYTRTRIDRGTLVECMPLGVLNMTDEGDKDYKVLCTPVSCYNRYNTMNDVDTLFLDVTRHFFQHYKDLDGRKCICGKWNGQKRAKQIILKDTIK